MLKRSLRKISFPVQLSHILRDTGILLWEMRDGDLKAPMEGALSKLKMKRIGIESSSEGYTSEIQRSASSDTRYFTLQPIREQHFAHVTRLDQSESRK